MDFANRLKKEMTEGIVRALLEDAGYRVIDCGIEKVLRELTCLMPQEYTDLGYPSAMRQLPDFTVMDRDQTKKYLVEVKYRQSWGHSVLKEVRPQVLTYGNMLLVSVYANAPNPLGLEGKLPSRYLRCCNLRFKDNVYEAELRGEWVPVEGLNVTGLTDNQLWWRTAKLYDVFGQLSEIRSDKTLWSAIEALAGILERPSNTPNS